jgi:hypothetical protein
MFDDLRHTTSRICRKALSRSKMPRMSPGPENETRKQTMTRVRKNRPSCLPNVRMRTNQKPLACLVGIRVVHGRQYPHRYMLHSGSRAIRMWWTPHTASQSPIQKVLRRQPIWTRKTIRRDTTFISILIPATCITDAADVIPRPQVSMLSLFLRIAYPFHYFKCMKPLILCI